MKHSKEDWLSQMIDEEVMKKADERERQLMEAEEIQDEPETDLEQLTKLRREVEKRKYSGTGGRKSLRVAFALAAVLILCLGVASVGSREYRPEVIQERRGEESTTRVENSDTVQIPFDEEEVYQEIQEKMGVIPVRFLYRPEGMELVEYEIYEREGEAIIKYKYEDIYVHVYISKDNENTSINYQMDGIQTDVIHMELAGMEVSVYERTTSEGMPYYGVTFEYLNTFYLISTMLNLEEFTMMLENILLKTV